MKATIPNSFFLGKILMMVYFTMMLFSTIEVSSQNFSGLENKELNKLDDLETVGVR